MALIRTIDDLKKHNSAISSEVELENIQSFISDAIYQQIIPAIGYEQYNALVTINDGNPTADQKQLIDLIVKSITGFTIANFTDNGAVQITNSGIFVIKTEKSAPASDKKLLALKRTNLKSAYNSLELALKFLETKLNLFTEYANSYERKANLSLLINFAFDFQRAGVAINYDAQIFNTLKTFVRSATETYIEPVLGEDIIATLYSGILQNNLSEDYKKLLQKACRPLAYFTMAEAIPYMVLSLSADGIFELSDTVGGISGNVENRNPVSDRRLASAMTGYNMKAEAELESLRKFLIKNKDAYAYTPADEIDRSDISNSNIYFL